MDTFPEDQARKAHRISASRHLKLDQLLRDYANGTPEQNEGKTTPVEEDPSLTEKEE